MHAFLISVNSYFYSFEHVNFIHRFYAYEICNGPIQAANTIKKVEGMNRLQSLTTLHLRDNQLEALDGFVEDLKMLQYINFR